MSTSVQMQGAIPKAYRDTVRDRNEADVRLWARPSGGRGRAPDCVAALGNGATIPEPGPEPGRLRERLLAEWVFTWQYNGLVSDRQNRLSIERWTTEVVPRVTAWEGPGSVD